MAVQEYGDWYHGRIESEILIKLAVHILFYSLLIVCCLCFGCKNKELPSTKQQTISVTDFRGKSLSFDKPVQRVVCLLESATSGLYMLQAEQTLVGISTNIYSASLYPYYSSLDVRIRNKNLPTPGNWDFVNLESVIALQPDLVILWSSQNEAIDALESHHIPIYAVMLNSVDDIYKEIKDFGILLNKHERADSLIKFTKLQIASLKQSREKSQSVYFMWASGMFETAGLPSTVNNVIASAGFINVCQSKQEHVSINAETLIHWNPDIILLWNTETCNPSDIIKTSYLRTLKAVRSKKVFELPSSFDCDLWTLKYQYAVTFLYNAVHNTSFSEETFVTKRDSMMTFLYGKPI